MYLRLDLKEPATLVSQWSQIKNKNKNKTNKQTNSYLCSQEDKKKGSLVRQKKKIVNNNFSASAKCIEISVASTSPIPVKVHCVTWMSTLTRRKEGTLQPPTK